MRKVDRKTTTFETGHEDFMIDIVVCPDHVPCKKIKPQMIREVWLYRENVGIKIFVTGELEEYWNGQTVKQFAEGMVEYIENDDLNCGNWYDYYDEDYLNYPDCSSCHCNN